MPGVTATPPAPTLDIGITPTLSSVTVDNAAGPTSATLTVWLPEEFQPGEQSAAGQTLAEQVTAFDQARPDVQVDFYPKQVKGTGGIAGYLRSAPPVAPDVLPDLALLDRDTLSEMARAGLVVPIGSLIDPAVIEGLYPVARAVGTVDGQLAGLPYLLEFDHAVYRETAFRRAPVSFQAVLDARQPQAVPAGAVGDVASAFLLQYMAAGGRLANDQGQPVLDAPALADVLTYYDNARKLGVFSAGNFQMSDARDGWAAYRDERAALVAMTSTVYLSEVDPADGTGLMPLPTPGGEPFTLVRGWCWVIVARDPARQAAAMALVNFLMNPVNQGRYSMAVGWLPSQPGALSVWEQDRAAYAAFAGRMLDNGSAMPDAASRAIVGAAIQDAFEATLLNNVSPVEAAAQAEAAVKNGP